MDTKVDRDALLWAVDLANILAVKRPVTPLQACCKLVAARDRLTVTANDWTTEAVLPIAAHSAKPGRVVVDTAHLHGILQRAAAGATISLCHVGGDKQLIVTDGTASYRLPTKSVADYPDGPDPDDQQGTMYEAQIAGAALQDLLRHTTYAVDSGSNKPWQTRVRVEVARTDPPALRATALHSHRLATSAQLCSDPGTIYPFYVPQKAAAVVQAIIAKDEPPVTITTWETGLAQIVTTHGQVTINPATVEWPQGGVDAITARRPDRQVRVWAGDLRRAVSRCRAVRSPDVLITVTSRALTVIASVEEVGDAEVSIPVVFNHAPITVRVNPEYVMAAVAMLRADAEVLIGFTDENNPMWIELPSSDYTALVMPVRT